MMNQVDIIGIPLRYVSVTRAAHDSVEEKILES